MVLQVDNGRGCERVSAGFKGGCSACKLSNGLLCGADGHLVYVQVPLESLISTSSCVP